MWTRRRRLLAAATAFTCTVVGAASWDLVRDLPDGAALARIHDTAQSTIVYGASDQPASAIFKQDRTNVPLAQVSPNFVRALIAVEDQRFYSHGAIDPPRIVAAAITNLLHARAVQGASTLTQQLARAAFLTPRKTLRRKLQEIVLAARIERRYSKPQILEMYANRVYFGDGFWGVEAASLGYFGKHASELTLPEGAMLAGLVKSPSTYAPTVDVGRAVRRRNIVLQAMHDTGAIDRATLEQGLRAPFVGNQALSREGPQGEYFFEEVRKSLIDRFGPDRVYEGGLRVYSTIDPEMQASAETAVATWLASLDARRPASKSRPQQPADRLQAALIALDPRTGYVRALVGGRSFAESRFNRAMQAHRQPGSAFKPFVYAAALDAGYTETSVLDHLDEPISTPQGTWLPDDEHVDAQSLDLRSALRVSSNRAAVRLLEQVGIPRVVQYAASAGLGTQPAVPSLALGSGDVTLASLTSAYAAFANGGWVRRPVLVRRVEDESGHVLTASADEASRAMSEATAFLMSDMLADVVNAGTGSQVRRLGFTLPAAGKTGTTNGFNDAWFIGYTPRLVVGVWVGFDVPHAVARNGFAATIAVPLWTRFMIAATHGDAPQWFEPPSGVTAVELCPISGKLATNECNDRRRQYFLEGTQPIEYCDVHSPSLFRRFVGLIAGRRPMPVERELSPDTSDSAAGTATASIDGSGPHEAPNEAKAAATKRGFWSRLLHRNTDR